MPPTKRQQTTSLPPNSGLKGTTSAKQTKSSRFTIGTATAFIKSMIFDVDRMPLVSILIILAELFINFVIINKVNYTEIDWKAYMQECEGFLNGTTDYSKLRGEFMLLILP